MCNVSLSRFTFHSVDLFAAANTSIILVILKHAHIQRTLPAINSSAALDAENPISFPDANVK